MNKPIRIAITVDGGIVADVKTDSPSLVDVIVIDIDDCKAEGTDEFSFTEERQFTDGSTLNQLSKAGQMFSIW